MSVHRGLSSYRQTRVQPRPPLELVVILYDRALTFLNVARAAIERRDLVARRDAVARARAILSELHRTLNRGDGGNIAHRLDALHGFAHERILLAVQQISVVPLDEAIRVLQTLRGSWVTMAATPAETAVLGAA